MIDDEIKRLEAIRDDESKPYEERHKAAVDLFQMLERETKKAEKAALRIYFSNPGGIYV